MSLDTAKRSGIFAAAAAAPFAPILDDPLPPSSSSSSSQPPAAVAAFWTDAFRSSPRSPWLVSKALLYSLLSYQPPVGIVAFWVTYQWLQQRYFGAYDPLGQLESFPLLQMFGLSTRQPKRRPKSCDLDATDRDYDRVGGVQTQALQNYRDRPATSGSTDRNKVEDPVRRVLETAACPPQASRWQCARQSVETLVQALEPSSMNNYEAQQQHRDVSVLLEVRALDALLRCLRDEVWLPRADRLRTRQNACQVRLDSYYTPSTQQWIRRAAQEAIDAVRRTTQNVLERILLPAAKRSRPEQHSPKRRHRRQHPASLREWRTEYQETSQQLQEQYERLGRLQETLLRQPHYQVSVGDSVNDNKDSNDPKQQQQQPQQIQMHLQQCVAWNAKAKAFLAKEFVRPRIQSTVTTTSTTPTDEFGHDIIERLEQRNDVGTMTTAATTTTTQRRQRQQQQWSIKQWKCVLELLQGQMSHQKSVLSSPSSFVEAMTQQWRYRNIVIPSAVLKVVLAKAVHRAVAPHWPRLRAAGREIGAAVWGIVEFRFYAPLKVVLLDLLNRRPRLLDPAQMVNEQASLNNMLRDLGIPVDGASDGSVSAESLAQASRMYEDQLKRGAVKNMIFGSMVRLLLIQVQQLKAELLQAFQSIDELVDANRLNVSLLATIPAFLLVRWGSRLVYSLLYRFRVRDVTGLKDAHVELTHRLRTLERILILGDNSKDSSSSNNSSNKESSNNGGQYLKGVQLGEFISHVHKYLLLLEYCQPPFPSKQVDSIYKDVQDLLPPGGLNRGTQRNLLQLIHRKNADLLKSL